MNEKIKEIVLKARMDFEQKKVLKKELIKLYNNYNKIKDAERFVDKAIRQFPKLNCGLSSLYLQEKLKTGKVVQGKYGRNNHTFLLVNDKIIDITADQYGGPYFYIGQLKEPWRLR